MEGVEGGEGGEGIKCVHQREKQPLGCFDSRSKNCTIGLDYFFLDIRLSHN